MITIKNLSKIYVQKKLSVKALDNVNLCLPDTGLIFITGRSGSGKSTLLNLIGCLDKFTSGDVIVDGTSLKKMKSREINDYHYEKVGFVFQNFNLLENYNVEKNILIGSNLEINEENETKVKEILKKVELEFFEKRKINTLSGGQAQRVALARAILKKPKILLCDEPTGQLDSETSELMFKVLKELSKESLVLVVTHDNLSAEKYGDRIIKLLDGKVQNDTSPINDNKNINKKEFNKKKISNRIDFKTNLMFGTGFFKHRLFRLFLSLLISIFSLSLLCLSDIMDSTKQNEIILNAMYENKHNQVSYVKKLYYKESDEYDYSENIPLFPNDIDFLENNIPIGNYKFIYDMFYRCDPHFKDGGPNYDSYFDSFFSGSIELTDDLIEQYNFKLYGEKPKNKNEIVISKYYYELLKYYEIQYISDYGPSKYDIIKSMDDLIGRSFYLELLGNFYEKKIYELDEYECDIKVKVTGILDTNFNYERYDYFGYSSEWGYNEEKAKHVDVIRNEIHEDTANGFHNLVYLKDGFYDDYINGILDKQIGYNRIIIPLSNEKKDQKLIDYDMKQRKYYLTNEDILKFNEDYSNVSYINVEKDKDVYITYELENSMKQSINEVSERFVTLNMIIKYIGFALIVIVILFNLYYFSGLIFDQEKEIGILRSFGISKKDITIIFLTMALCISIISTSISFILSTIVLEKLNIYLKDAFYLPLMYYKMEFKQIIMIIIVVIVSLIIGLIIPLLKLLRKKIINIISKQN